MASLPKIFNTNVYWNPATSKGEIMVMYANTGPTGWLRLDVGDNGSGLVLGTYTPTSCPGKMVKFWTMRSFSISSQISTAFAKIYNCTSGEVCTAPVSCTTPATAPNDSSTATSIPYSSVAPPDVTNPTVDTSVTSQLTFKWTDTAGVFGYYLVLSQGGYPVANSSGYVIPGAGATGVIFKTLTNGLQYDLQIQAVSTSNVKSPGITKSGTPGGTPGCIPLGCIVDVTQ